MRSIDVGDKIPSFTLPDQDGTPHPSEALYAKGPLVLFFYPKDETSGCTREACSFRDAHEEFLAAGANVVGISSDGVASHKGFANHHRLRYLLLADVGGQVRKLFGVPKSFLGLVPGRVTYVVDRAGVVRHRFDSQVRVLDHAKEALATVRALAREQRASAPSAPTTI